MLVSLFNTFKFCLEVKDVHDVGTASTSIYAAYRTSGRFNVDIYNAIKNASNGSVRFVRQKRTKILNLTFILRLFLIFLCKTKLCKHIVKVGHSSLNLLSVRQKSPDDNVVIISKKLSRRIPSVPLNGTFRILNPKQVGLIRVIYECIRWSDVYNLMCTGGALKTCGGSRE